MDLVMELQQTANKLDKLQSAVVSVLLRNAADRILTLEREVNLLENENTELAQELDNTEIKIP